MPEIGSSADSSMFSPLPVDIPVAVVGIGCRFGGGIDSPERLWHVVAEGIDVVTEVPSNRWDIERVYDPEPGVPGKTQSRWGAFLDDVVGFEPEFFALTDREAELIDPQFRLLLETSCEALEHAGLAPHGLRGSRTAVMVGCSYEDYMDMLDFDRGLRSPDAAHGIIGTTRFTSSSRIAYLLDLKGPAITLDTACSSSLIAVHLAAQALRTGEVDLALAGGVMLSLQAKNTLVFSALGVLSPHGRCAAFDRGADGYVRGEGCGMIALKRLADAQAAGDRVLAVLRGTGTNNNGRSDTMLSPSAEGHKALQRDVLARSGVDPAHVALIETHGPGTSVGDPIEYAALREVYGVGDVPCALGSIKTNIGHCETAAGIAGLIKAVLAVQHGYIPGNLHFETWNPEIDPSGCRLFVPTELQPWPQVPGQRLAAVSSYGMSGTNAHIVVGQAPDPIITAHSDRVDGPEMKLYPLTAGSESALAATAGRLAAWLTGPGKAAPLTDIAHTLAHRREHRRFRATVAATDRTELVNRLRQVADGTPDSAIWLGSGTRQHTSSVWLFSGQGSQWAGMGRELLTTEPAFAAMVDRIEPLVYNESGFSVRAAMSADEVVTGFASVQPTLFAMQVALAAAWRARGVHPTAVIGHSMGEIAAAVVAGAISLADGVAVVCRRSGLLGRLGVAGAMAQIGLSHHEVATELHTSGSSAVGIAAFSSPTTTVISGDERQVGALVSAWQQRGVAASVIAVDVASHSAQIDPVLDELRQCLAEVRCRPTDIGFYSTVLADPHATPTFDRDYWADNLRLPVRFADACRSALSDGHRAFIEVSPHPLLTRFVTEIATLSAREATVLPTLLRGVAEPTGLLGAVAAAYCSGFPVSWAEHRAGKLVDVPLPVWAKRPLWMPDALRAHREDPTAATSLAGVHVRLPDDDLGAQHVWQADVGTTAYPWLDDHKVYGAAAMPGTGYVEIAHAMAADLFPPETLCQVEDLRFHALLALDPHTIVTSRATVSGEDNALVEICSDGDDGPQLLASATITRADADTRTAAIDIDAMLAAQLPAGPVDPVYATGRAKGIDHGAGFAGLTSIYGPGLHPGTVVAALQTPAVLRTFSDTFQVHPALLDLCLQTMGAHPSILEAESTFLPLSIGAVRRIADPHRARWCRAQIHRSDDRAATADIDLIAADGTVVVQILDARIGAAAGAGSDADRRLLRVEWEPTDLSATAGGAGGFWLVCTETAADPLTQSLARALLEAGHSCTIAATGRADTVQLSRAIGEHLDGGGNRLVMLCPPPERTPSAKGLDDARDRIRQLVTAVTVLTEHHPEQPVRLFVVTREAQPAPGSGSVTLEQAGLRGLCRVIGGEHPRLRTTYIDVAADIADAKDLVNELLADSTEDELAWRDGTRFAARLRPAPLPDNEFRTTLVQFGVDGLAVAPGRRGDLDTVGPVTRARRAPGPDEVEIRVHAASLNFRDVLNALGNLATHDDRFPPLGYDCAGEIAAVGPDVLGLKVGDRVAVFTAGALATFVTVPAALVITVPEGVSYDQASTLPLVNLTAWYALKHLADLQRNEHILIHSATGGLGMAAIALADSVGAVIHATAGTEAKRRLLRDMGITHVYNSRTTEFAERIRTCTHGTGVDVVLNSLTGPALRAGIDLLRPGGRFIELGKRDIHADRKIGLASFERNITFATVDLAFILEAMPELMQKLVREVSNEIATSRMGPIPHTTYPLTELTDALRTMAAARHTGKLVIAFPPHGTARAVVPPEEFPYVRGDGAYIITGGLGGLGLLLAKDLAAHGAARIVLNGRRAPSSDASAVINELRAGGTDIAVELGDIADPATSRRLVENATTAGVSLRGIAHAAAVLHDATVARIDDELLGEVWAPKVAGAWHLDQAAIDQPLDWWLNFSSAATLIGNPGQGAYAAANGWLDAFTSYRRSRGRTAHSIQWGAWADHGRGVALGDRGFTMITPKEGLAACQRVLRHDRAHTGVLPITDARAFIGDRIDTIPFFDALAIRNRAAPEQNSVRHQLRTELSTAGSAQRCVLLTDFLLDRLATILRRNRATLDADSPLTESGLDSLMALELRTHIDTNLGISIAAKEIWKHGTAAALAAHLSICLPATPSDARTAAPAS